MKKIISGVFSLPWHPLAFGVYPVLTLFANNIRQAEMVVLLRPLALAIVFSLALLLVLRMGFSNWYRVAFSAAAIILLFFSYGHIYSSLKTLTLFGMVLGRHRILLLIWAILAVMVLVISSRKHLKLERLTVTLNVMALVLLLFPVFTLTSHWLSVRNVPRSQSEPATKLTVVNGQSLPDVYFIVLDSYTRSDVLKEVYGYDNSWFLNQLKELGFYVAECSTSNYMWTHLSISSALNLEYLQDHPIYTAAPDKDIITEDLIKHSLVRKTLESIGYQTVAFATGFPFNEIADADVYLEPPASMKSARGFDALLAQTTLLRVFQDFGYIQINQTASAEFRDRTLFALEQFDALARMKGPKFVYIHIITPHPPFVFGPNGESVNPKDFISTEGQYTDETYFQGYVDQVKFISNRILVSVQELLAGSSTPPLIILQGDHGPWKQQGENRVSILNAYYLPEHQGALYPGISPVNSFRVILNEYFSTNYPLLEDKSYRSAYRDQHNFQHQPTSCGVAR